VPRRSFHVNAGGTAMTDRCRFLPLAKPDASALRIALPAAVWPAAKKHPKYPFRCSRKKGLTDTAVTADPFRSNFLSGYWFSPLTGPVLIPPCFPLHPGFGKFLPVPDIQDTGMVI